MGGSQSICADSVRAAINVSLLFLAWSEQCSKDPEAIRAFYHLKGTMSCHGGPNVGYFCNFFLSFPPGNDRISQFSQPKCSWLKNVASDAENIH